MAINACALQQLCFSLHLFISCVLIIFIGIDPSSVCSAAPAPAPAPALSPTPAPAKLIHDICKNISNYNFCEKLFLSNPSTNPLPTEPVSQQKAIAEVAFGLAYGYASYVSDCIDRLLKNATSLEKQLQECAVYYGAAIEELIESLEDIDVDSMKALGDPAETACLATSGCDVAFKGRPNSPLAAMNRHMRLLSEICLAVSKLFA